MVNDRLAEKLRRDVLRLERNIKFRKIYILKNNLSLGLANSGLAFDRLMPFILSAVLVGGGYYNLLNSDSSFNEVTEVPMIERSITSTGFESEQSFAEKTSDSSSIQYSTGWQVNDNGLYERKITTFEPLDNSVFSDVDSLLAMSSEELYAEFKVANIDIIQKSELDSEDMPYNEEMVTVNKVMDDVDNAYIREKNTFEKNVDSCGVVILSGGLGFVLYKVKKKVIGDKFKNRLKQYKASCMVMSSEELKRLWVVKKKNLELFDDNYNNERPKIKSRGRR